jgi:hypothetical protein
LLGRKEAKRAAASEAVLSVLEIVAKKEETGSTFDGVVAAAPARLHNFLSLPKTSSIAAGRWEAPTQVRKITFSG